MYQGTRIEKNKLIKQLLFTNIFLVISVTVGIYWLTILIACVIILYFIIKYFKNKKSFNIKNEHLLKVFTGNRDFSILDINAGVIEFQIFVLFNYILLAFNINFWWRIIALLPIAFLASVFEEEYKSNKNNNN